MSSVWKAECASVIGQSHIARNKPCQDSSVVRSLRLNGEDLLVAAVSDGAGSASHSQVGSKTVCLSFLEMVERTAAKDVDALWTPDFFAAWFNRCLDRLAEDARREKVSFRQLAATALLTIVGPDRAIFFQIGDGGMVFSCPDGRQPPEFSWVFWPDKGEEYTNLATFVTTPGAISTAECCLFGHRVDRLAIFSDGIEHAALVDRNRSVHAPFFTKCFGLFEQPPQKAAAAQLLEQVLSSPSLAQTSDDDKSLVLAVRSRG